MTMAISTRIIYQNAIKPIHIIRIVGIQLTAKYKKKSELFFFKDDENHKNSVILSLSFYQYTIFSKNR